VWQSLTLSLRTSISIQTKQFLTMSIEMLSNFAGVEFFKRTAPHMGTMIPHNANFPMIWDQNKLQQEPKWEGTPLSAFGATHGAVNQDKMERKMAEHGGMISWRWQRASERIGKGIM